MFLVADGTILEGEVPQAVFVRCSYIEEVLRVNIYVAEGNVVALGQGHIRTVAGLEELRPGTNHEERGTRTLDILHTYLLVVLRGQ